MQSSDEGRLVESAAAGDAAAREALLQRHLAELNAYVRLRVGPGIRSRESSLDIAQSVCREVLGDLDRFEYRGANSFRNWLLLRAEHKIRDRGRFWSREKRAAALEVPIHGGHGRPAGEDDEQGVLEQLRCLFTPSRDAVAREELEELERAFARLPEDYRRVIVLSRVLGLAHEEIAREMERSPNATRTLLSRALARLAVAMENGQGRNVTL
jgi:RNA polymerase sigma-70 factor (ECF subfamily)